MFFEKSFSKEFIGFGFYFNYKSEELFVLMFHLLIVFSLKKNNA